MSWKGVLGSLLVGGSQGYLAGKQQEWADESQQLKSQAAARLKQGERQWTVEDREAGFAHDVEMEKLKQTSQRERDETQHGRALELARVKAGPRGAGGSDSKPLTQAQAVKLDTENREAYQEYLDMFDTGATEGFFGFGAKEGTKTPESYQQWTVKNRPLIADALGMSDGGDVVQPPQPIMIDADSPGAAISGMLGKPKQKQEKPERRTDAATTEDITRRTEQIRGATAPEHEQVRPDSKETNIILPALKKLANTEFNLADALGAIGSAIGKLAGGTAEATVPAAESAVRESAKAVAARIEQRVGELSQDEAVQLKRYVDSMLKNKAITQEAANQIIAMINRGDTASVSELLRSL